MSHRFKKEAVNEIKDAFDRELIRIAGIEEEERKTLAELTVKSAQKIVDDFHDSLQKALDSLGAYSNVEKHMNELVHRANFRFSDLHNLICDSRQELSKCQSLGGILKEELEKQLSEAADEEEKGELSAAADNLRKLMKKAQSCEQTLQN